VHAPRLSDLRSDPDTVERQPFSTAILPPWVRKTAQTEQVLPLLYLKRSQAGISCPRWAVPRLGQGVRAGDDWGTAPTVARNSSR
jgi:hypothetical protein